MINLKNLNRSELTVFFESLGEKPFRAVQAAKWIYQSGALDFERMTDLGKALRRRLAETAELESLTYVTKEESADGSVKFLWELRDGLRIESVLMPEKDHYTLCVSSQVGCAMGCRFCRTGGLKLKRNLTQAEIVDQVILSRKALPDGCRLTNIVFMGMGEPLANRENVIRALSVLTDPDLVGISKRHVSLSTVGLIPELPFLAATRDIGLTISLSASNDQLRDRIMPINRKFSMKALHEALAIYPLPRGRRITIAYVLLAGVNDSLENAAELARYLHGLRVKINLIPFNPFPGSEFERPSDEAVDAFQDYLIRKSYTVVVRKSKGRDISAACGQLAGQAPGVGQ